MINSGIDSGLKSKKNAILKDEKDNNHISENIVIMLGKYKSKLTKPLKLKSIMKKKMEEILENLNPTEKKLTNEEIDKRLAALGGVNTTAETIKRGEMLILQAIARDEEKEAQERKKEKE